MNAPPLRILAIVNLPWDARLGAARVWMELAEEWTRAGHIVEKFCLTDAFPRATSSSVLATLRTAWFPRRAQRYLRENAERFDVVDCLIGTLPFPKKELDFRGLFVARSVGLFRLYDKFLRAAAERWPEKRRGSFLGQIFHGELNRQFRKSADVSLTVCDLVNLPNDEERAALAADPCVRATALVQPYGLSDNFREALGRAAAPAAERLRHPKICFIGTWSVRKGSRDWPRIIEAICAARPETTFLFLGTMCDESIVRAELGANANRVICLPKYTAADLPKLLADCTLALFPSYIEGFGLAVLEQLAAGIPTIAYNVPGPRQILPGHLLTPAGEAEKMSERALEILALSLPGYKALAAEAYAIAARFRWSEIAAATIEQYRHALASLGK